MKPAYSLEDLRLHLERFLSNGSKGLPNITDISDDDRLELEGAQRILAVMTKDQRTNVDLLLDKHVRQRIAVLSGSHLRDVDTLISQVARVRMLMRQLPKSSGESGVNDGDF